MTKLHHGDEGIHKVKSVGFDWVSVENCVSILPNSLIVLP